MGFLDKLKIFSNRIEKNTQTVPTEVKAAQPAKKKIPYGIPLHIGSASKVYDRKVKLTFVNKDAVEAALQNDRRVLTMTLVDGRAHAFLDGTDLGALPKREGFDEWLGTGEPYKALLEPADDKGNYKVRVALYRDLPKYYADHEQTIVGLTGYKSKKAQDVIDYIPEESVLYAREDSDNYDRVVVFYDETVIGFMPNKISKRFLDADPVLTVYDHGDDDDNDKIQPFVRIYW